MIDGKQHRLKTDIALGHKIARIAMKPGDKVLRYGVPIGSTTRSVAAAEHVHTQNLQSDYISAHGRDAARSQEIRS
ncbi:hypothetical protein ACMT1E_03880 [Sphingomonas flavalba]|uniref:hypothetical protein n=1 Tax=Sphingomonas flavalba TaxID=2559804 RepID=UPI0039E0EB9E